MERRVRYLTMVYTPTHSRILRVRCEHCCRYISIKILFHYLTDVGWLKKQWYFLLYISLIILTTMIPRAVFSLCSQVVRNNHFPSPAFQILVSYWLSIHVCHSASTNHVPYTWTILLRYNYLNFFEFLIIYKSFFPTFFTFYWVISIKATAPRTTSPPTRPAQIRGVRRHARPAVTTTTRRPGPTGTQHDKRQAQETAEMILNEQNWQTDDLCNFKKFLCALEFYR